MQNLNNKKTIVSNKSILDFLKTNTPITRLIENSSSLNYRKITLLGFRKNFFSLKEFLILLLPTIFSVKRKYLPRQWEFLHKETKKEMAAYISDDGAVNLLCRPFVGPNYTILIELVRGIVARDQYHAKEFIKEDSVIIDAGANIGVFTVFAASIAQKGHVYAFEPVKGTFPFLKKNAGYYSNITCVNQGLGNQRTQKNILNMGAGEGGNVLEDSPFYKHYKHKTADQLESVMITTIDEFVAEHKITRIDFIKIDTEGYEANVLQGAKETIKKYRPTISMSAYHNPKDKEQLPRILKNICPEYICELYQDLEDDLVCYIKKENSVANTPVVLDNSLKNVQPVNIVFASDENYAFALGVAVCSLLENKQGDYLLKIFVLDAGLSSESRERIKRIAEQHHSFVEFLAPDDNLFAELPTSVWPVAACYRLIVARLLPKNIKRAFYLDCDILVRGDISHLFYADLCGNILGAVFDNVSSDESCERLNISKNIGYFNSGVLLIDLMLWKKNKIEEKLFDFITNNKEKLKFPDNDALNAVLQHQWLRLSSKYNVLPDLSAENPLIVHFTSEKPWYRFSALPYQKEYLFYLSKTPWKNKGIKRFIAPSFAKKFHFFKIGLALKKFFRKIKKDWEKIYG